jgi:hypothetical protein
MTRTIAPTPTSSTRVALPHRDTRDALRFDLRELSGSLGDLGTFLPLAVAMALTCGMDLGLIFIFAGLMNVMTGLWLRQPVPVQPMKAIAAVAIAEGLSPGAIAAAGVLAGAAVLALAMSGGIDRLVRLVPKAVIRGIQAGVGLKLAWTGLVWLGALPAVGWDSWLIAAGIGLVVLLSLGRRQPVLLYIFVVGFGLLWLVNPDAYRGLALQWPAFHIVLPTTHDWWAGLTLGAIPQLPLTLLNSVIAVCALSSDYFPGRGIEPRRMAASVGMMNLLCVPFGGMPMCHGAGGLAAQYHFGARTGGSVVMLGVLKIAAGLLLGAMLLTTLLAYPVSILAVMVIVAGLMLAKAARDALRPSTSAELLALPVFVATVVPILLWNTLGGFLVGLAVAGAIAASSRWWRR